MKTLHFKTKKGYEKWQAYKHMRTPTGKLVEAKLGRRSIAKLSPANIKILISGHVHKIKHK